MRQLKWCLQEKIPHTEKHPLSIKSPKNKFLQVQSGKHSETPTVISEESKEHFVREAEVDITHVALFCKVIEVYTDVPERQ